MSMVGLVKGRKAGTAATGKAWTVEWIAAWIAAGIAATRVGKAAAVECKDAPEKATMATNGNPWAGIRTGKTGANGMRASVVAGGARGSINRCIVVGKDNTRDVVRAVTNERTVELRRTSTNGSPNTP